MTFQLRSRFVTVKGQRHHLLLTLPNDRGWVYYFLSAALGPEQEEDETLDLRPGRGRFNLSQLKPTQVQTIAGGYTIILEDPNVLLTRLDVGEELIEVPMEVYSALLPGSRSNQPITAWLSSQTLTV